VSAKCTRSLCWGQLAAGVSGIADIEKEGIEPEYVVGSLAELQTRYQQ
jgi:hypothetical protein